MENPIKAITIVGNQLEIVESGRLPSEFSLDTPTITIEFEDLSVASSNTFREDRTSVYTFGRYGVSIGKVTKAAKTNKELTKLTKENEKLNITIDTLNSTINEYDEAAKENVAAMNAAIKEADELRAALEAAKENNELDIANKQIAALMEEIDRLKADIIRLTMNPIPSTSPDKASGD